MESKEYGLNSKFIELAGELNFETQEFVLKKVSHDYNSNNKSVNGSKILVLGLAYKPNVDDARESPSLSLFSSLSNMGA